MARVINITTDLFRVIERPLSDEEMITALEPLLSGRTLFFNEHRMMGYYVGDDVFVPLAFRSLDNKTEADSQHFIGVHPSAHDIFCQGLARRVTYMHRTIQIRVTMQS